MCLHETACDMISLSEIINVLSFPCSLYVLPLFDKILLLNLWRCTYNCRFAKIPILKQEGSTEKKFLWAQRLAVGDKSLSWAMFRKSTEKMI